MEYMGDKGYWDEKFSVRGDKPLSPERVVVENIKYFKRGTVLDVACGDGRNALLLLEEGFQVTGIDFSNEALIRLEKFAEENNYEVTTKLVDLRKENAFNDMGVFDNILINHYRLSKNQLVKLANHISESGILLVSGFGHNHKTDIKIGENELIQPSDFEDLGNLFELMDYKDHEDERGFFVTYIFRKKVGKLNG